MLNIISKQSVCLCACKRSERTRVYGRKVSQTNLTDWELNLTANANITLTDIWCCSLSSWDRQTVSNNCEHLGSLHALHPSPWGSSPGTGRPTQLPIPLESCLEQADYHTSPRRDMRPGILSNSFTLIITTEWQCGENADTYQQCTTKPSHSIKKSTFTKL